MRAQRSQLASSSLLCDELVGRGSKSGRWAAPIIFGPRTLLRTWGTRPIPFGFLRWHRIRRLDVLEWACEIPIHRRAFVRLLDDDRLPV